MLLYMPCQEQSGKIGVVFTQQPFPARSRWGSWPNHIGSIGVVLGQVAQQLTIRCPLSSHGLGAIHELCVIALTQQSIALGTYQFPCGRCTHWCLVHQCKFSVYHENFFAVAVDLTYQSGMVISIDLNHVIGQRRIPESAVVKTSSAGTVKYGHVSILPRCKTVVWAPWPDSEIFATTR